MQKATFLFVLVAAAGIGQAADKTNPFAADPKAADTGRGMFRIYCSACHGIRAEGGRGPDLTRAVYNVGEKDADIYKVISAGSPGTDMPSYDASLGDEGIWRIVSFLRSVSKKDTETAKGDPAAGDRLFWGKGGCGQCHRVGRRGGRLGPDLSMVGRTRSLKYLRDSVIDPDADLAADVARIEVVTRDGRKIVGVQRSYDFFSVQLMDLQENYHSFFKDEVRSVKREMKSVMPNYSKSLSSDELNNLLAYMQTLGREASR